MNRSKQRRMGKKAIVVLLVGLALAFVHLADAQQPKKMYRLGFISNRTGMGPNEEAFRRGLRDLGYIEGENLVIEWRFVSGQLDRYPEVAVELVRLHCCFRIRSQPGGQAIDQHYTHSDDECKR
jgi:putative tryptophan/tyrosine transport system substrate-binding protein